MPAAERIFIFLEIFAREGGIQSYVKDIFQAYLQLSPTELESAAVFLLRDEIGGDNPYEQGNLAFYYGKTRSPCLGRLKLTYSLLTRLLFGRPQHVYCGHIKLAVLIKTLCQPLGIPYTVLTYGKEVWSPLPVKQRQALQQAHCVWTISRYSCDRLCQANEIDPSKVKILPCVVDGTVFSPGTKPPELINKYNLADAKVLMTVARLWSGDIYKGVDVTIRALPQILQVFPDVKYLVIGRGDDRPRLEQLAQDLNVSDRVIFANFIPNDALADHYRLADAYIMPSQEGFGIVYLEAMACGKPVLSGDADGSADPLQDGKLGWRVPHRDPDAVAKACLEIIAGNEQRCNGEWLRQETLAKFSQEALGRQLRELLNY
jgi:phosphatidyl-myo-inositol dimannoside synthase